MKAAWFTDIHLDCVQDAHDHVSKMALQAHGSDAIFISGDISVSHSLIPHLKLLDEVLQKQFYFVLGNHDFYFSNISTVRKAVAEVCAESSFCRYLSNIPFVRIGKDVILVGHDGWYDAKNGDINFSQIIMNDWLKISDYAPARQITSGGIQISKNQIAQIAQTICVPAVKHIANGIKCAIREKAKKIIIVTHVPPFAESFVYNQNKGMKVQDALPWYTSQMMGNMLYMAAKTCPNIEFVVLSGHTHSSFDEKLLSNLTVKVGVADYGSPRLVEILNI